MKIRVMNRNIESLKMYLDGKRRIMTYGAGVWANDIKKMLSEYGYNLDYAIVDAPYCDGNTYMDKYGGTTMVISMDKLNPSYDPQMDEVVGDEKVAFIKMDVEGAELEALKGARTVIERDMPVLAVSAYHRQEDLITLIPYIHSLCNNSERYDLYLRHHGVVQSELVLYAIPTAYSED